MDYNIDATKAMIENLPEYMKKQEPKEMPDNDFSRFMINFGSESWYSYHHVVTY